MDRTEQVNWLRELAGNIVSTFSHSNDDTAEELVEFALSEEVRSSWNIDLPEWFEDHDRRLLTEFIESELH